MELNIKTISVIVGIVIGSTTIITSTYNGIAWVVRTADMLVYLNEYTTGTNNKIYEIDKRVKRIEEKI